MRINGIYVYFLSHTSPTSVCDFLLHLVAGNVTIRSGNRRDAMPVSMEALTHLLDSESVKTLTISFFNLNYEQSRTLSLASKLNRLGIYNCSFWDDGQEFAATLKSPKELHICRIQNFDARKIAMVLQPDTTSIETLEYRFKGRTNWDPFLDSLTNNRSLVDLRLGGNVINEESWRRLWHVIEHHKSLKRVDLCCTRSTPFVGAFEMSADRLARRTRTIVSALERNTQLEEILLSKDERDDQIYRNLVLPRLDLNKFRHCVQSVREACGANRGKKFIEVAAKAGNDLGKGYLLVRENVDFLCQQIPSTLQRRRTHVRRRPKHRKRAASMLTPFLDGKDLRVR